MADVKLTAKRWGRTMEIEANITGRKDNPDGSVTLRLEADGWGEIPAHFSAEIAKKLLKERAP